MGSRDFATMETVRFDADLVRRYGGRGPRYTSYPTALQFSEQLTRDQYANNAIASNSSGRPLSLYVHIPFCHSLCYYCGCNKIVTRNAARVARYIECLHREIEMQSALFDPSRHVEQLHFGGGTPTYLDRDQLAALIAKLEQHFSFAKPAAREFSIEVDPRTVDDDGIRSLAELGFNRLSLGIQDFDAAVQQAVNRIQGIDEVRALTNSARSAGFLSVSYDLIYGLPLQSVDGFSRTLDHVIELRPDRLAVYNYAHLPSRFRGQRMIRDEDIPSPASKLEILGMTIERLTAAGYRYVGMDHFALPDDDLVIARGNGSLQRNFQGYSTHGNCDLVGLGTSAIASIGNMFSQNSVTTMEYQLMIDEDRLPVRKGILVDADDRLRGAAIQSLMCYDELRFDVFGAEHGIDFRDYFRSELQSLQPLADDGLVKVNDAGIFVTPAGRLLLRQVAMAFDRYLSEADERFSKAI